MSFKQELQRIIKQHFPQCTISPMAAGATKAQISKINTPNNHTYIVKCEENSLKNDYLSLIWLNGKVPVPQVVFYEKIKEYEILCMTALKGHPLSYYLGKWPNKKIVELYAHALQLLHNLKIDDAAPIQTIEKRIEVAKFNLENNIIDYTNLESEFQSIAPNELFEQLIYSRPNTQDLVFTHGDYSFDNLMFDGENFTGFIDLDKAGVADKYQDIALAVRSIKGELNEKYLPFFFKNYNLNEIDQSKITFYTLLDEFF